MCFRVKTAVMVAIFGIVAVAHAGESGRVNLSLDVARFTYSPEMTLAAGELRLARTHLLTLGPGNTDHHQAEPLSGSVWGKVHFDVAQLPEADGELYLVGDAKEVLLNGVLLEAPRRLFSTGWKQVNVPVKALRKGMNEVVLRGGGQLLVEPGRPGHSFKSTDGGKTWTQDTLTRTGEVSGEYLVRLRLFQHPPRGWAVSPIVDVGPSTKADEVPEVTFAKLPKQPERTAVKVFVRLGATPSPEDKTPPKKGRPKAAPADGNWTGWLPVDEKIMRVAPEAGQRWLQWKLVFESQDGRSSPGLPGPLATGVVRKGAAATFAAVSAKHEPPADSLVQGLPFVYQAPSPRLDYLRKHYKLDEVIAPGKTELEQFMLLRYWIRNQWHTAWQGHPAGWMPPWDALIILECKDQPECLTMCTHYAAVFTQCCQALGWNARHCILDHHCVSEVYSFEHDRWIMMDTGNSAKRADVGFHCERKGVPLSARELHLALRDKELADITVHFTPWRLSKQIQHLCREAPKGKSDSSRPDTVSLTDLPKFPVCQVENFRRYGFPARNNYLTTLFPGELYQGLSQYAYDGYWWVGDDRNHPKVSPEYSKLLDPGRDQDVDWKLGGARVDLSRNLKTGQIQVDLVSLMPNHARFEIWQDKAWATTPATLSWTPALGGELRVRSVNAWGRAGRETRVTILADK